MAVPAAPVGPGVGRGPSPRARPTPERGLRLVLDCRERYVRRPFEDPGGSSVRLRDPTSDTVYDRSETICWRVVATSTCPRGPHVFVVCRPFVRWPS